MSGTTNFHFINNEFIPGSSDATYTVYNPANDNLVNKINLARSTEVDAAVQAARNAYESGPWATYTGTQRAILMNKFADLLAKPENVEEIVKAEVEAMGQPSMATRMGIIPSSEGIWRYFAGWADKITGENLDQKNGWWRLTKYEPLGVCAGIGPWNVTTLTLAFKVAPAIAAGNTFIYKASEKSPFSVLVLARLFKEAGFPPGVINIISGDGPTGALLASHMGIDKISFTGSGSAGRKVVDAANKSNMKKVTLELGGKSPSLVFEDADIKNAVMGNSRGFLYNSGQICVAASRLFVQSSIAPAFIDALKSAFEAVDESTGDPTASATAMGPLADTKQLESVLRFIEAGKKEAKLLVGGEKKGDKGAFVQPTIFLDAGDGAKIYREEIFGPVLTVRTFETEEEGLKLANDTSYGLSAAIYTGSTSRALRVASKIKAGTIAVNGTFLPDADTPFGGYKQSGSGRELGKEGLLEYLQVKTIKINM
ncbi:putative aldehyde dehydrogenase, partial [Dendryphion nanum]